MRCKKGHRFKKAYGSELGVYWCYGCDGEQIPSEPNKSRVRRKAKKEIKEEVAEYGHSTGFDEDEGTHSIP